MSTFLLSASNNQATQRPYDPAEDDEAKRSIHGDGDSLQWPTSMNSEWSRDIDGCTT